MPGPYIWIPKYPIRKRKEIERTIEHIVETSTKNLEKIESPKVSSSGPKYFSFKELERLSQKAQNDEMGKISVIRDSEGRTFLKAGSQKIEIKRKRFEVAKLDGEKTKVYKI